jgi:hypothetical protein
MLHLVIATQCEPVLWVAVHEPVVVNPAFGLLLLATDDHCQQEDGEKYFFHEKGITQVNNKPALTQLPN